MLMKRFLETPLRFRISVVYSGLIVLVLLVLNVLTTRYPWSVYPALGLLWWPLSAYFYGRRQPLVFALCGAGLVSATSVFLWLFTSFGAHPWYMYPVLGVFWWPLSVWGARQGARKFSVVAAEYIIAMTLAINLLTSPGYWWWLYPAVLVVWWPLLMHLPRGKHKEGETP